MDASLSTLVRCEKLSLSSNNIEKIANLNGLKHLKILSLARNNIKSFTGLEAVADTLEELWISHNNIEKLKGLNVLKKLKVLYMSNNNVKDHAEFVKLADLPYLEELLFLGNPMIETWNEDQHKMTYKEYAEQKLAKLKKLDGVPVVRKDEE